MDFDTGASDRSSGLAPIGTEVGRPGEDLGTGNEMLAVTHG